MNEIIPIEEKEFNIDAYISKRKEFITKVNKIMVEGKDYYVIQGKKSLAKGGAEKIAAIFAWSASFEKDEQTISAFKLDGLISFVCNLTKQGQLVGQGRGAALLSKNGGDPNKTIKMSQKSAFIDAVLRSSGLSDFFTQDLEDMAQISTPAPKASKKAEFDATGPIKPITQKQAWLIKALETQNGLEHISDENLRKMNLSDASKEIKRLQGLEKEDGMFMIDPPDLPPAQQGPYNYPEGD